MRELTLVKPLDGTPIGCAPQERQGLRPPPLQREAARRRVIRAVDEVGGGDGGVKRDVVLINGVQGLSNLELIEVLRMGEGASRSLWSRRHTVSPPRPPGLSAAPPRPPMAAEAARCAQRRRRERAHRRRRARARARAGARTRAGGLSSGRPRVDFGAAGARRRRRRMATTRCPRRHRPTTGRLRFRRRRRRASDAAAVQFEATAADAGVARLVDMGFAADDASAALVRTTAMSRRRWAAPANARRLPRPRRRRRRWRDNVLIDSSRARASDRCAGALPAAFLRGCNPLHTLDEFRFTARQLPPATRRAAMEAISADALGAMRGFHR